MYIEEITPDLVGQYISCYIKGEFVEKGLITYNESREKYYIAQSIQNGSTNPEYDYEEFCYTWSVKYGDKKDISSENVTNIQLLNYEKIYEVW